MAERLTTEQVRELVAQATPGPWHADIQPSDIGGARCAVVRLPGGAPDDGGDLLAEIWTGPGDVSLMASAYDLAADILDARRGRIKAEDRRDILAHALASISAELGLTENDCDPETVCAAITELRRERDEANAQVEERSSWPTPEASEIVGAVHERARIEAWLRSEPETVTWCDGHRHANGESCAVLRPLTLTEAADAIERGEDK